LDELELSSFAICSNKGLQNKHINCLAEFEDKLDGSEECRILERKKTRRRRGERNTIRDGYASEEVEISIKSKRKMDECRAE
jgi:hypothetical protein